MEKSKLNKFIQKYNLGGNVNSVKWTTGTNKLKTSFVTPDKSLLGTVVADNIKFENEAIFLMLEDLVLLINHLIHNQLTQHHFLL